MLSRHTASFKPLMSRRINSLAEPVRPPDGLELSPEAAAAKVGFSSLAPTLRDQRQPAKSRLQRGIHLPVREVFSVH
jgi:hypothetical protein